MKSFIYTLAAALAVMIACDDITPDTGSQDSDTDITPSPPLPTFVTDTTIYLCGLEYPEGYDWKRDTAYGKVSASLVLFKGKERLLTINTGGSTGISSSEDKHHLIQEHIYTEHIQGDRTVIGRDGRELFSYKGREVLRGMLVQGTDIYTLGQNIGGRGFSYRKNGKVMIAREDSSILSQMSSNPFYPSGALYMDGDHICFSYVTEQEDGGYLWTAVTDGMEKGLAAHWSPTELFDMRIVSDEVFWLRSKPGSRECILLNGATETQIGAKGRAARRCAIGVDSEGEVVVSGQFQDSGGQWTSGFWTHGTGFKVMIGESYHYLMKGRWGHISYLPSGSINVNCPGRPSTLVSGSGYFYTSFRNAAPAGDRIVLGLNPANPGDGPGFWLDGVWTEIALHGFLTAVHAELTTRKED